MSSILSVWSIFLNIGYFCFRTSENYPLATRAAFGRYTPSEKYQVCHTPGPILEFPKIFENKIWVARKRAAKSFPGKKNIWKKIIFRPFQNPKFKTHFWGRLRIGNLALTRGNLFFKYFVKLKTDFETQFRDHFGRAGKYDKKAWWKTPF